MPRKLRKDKPHCYINADGKDVPSVTHIIQVIRKKGVQVWANWLGFKRVNLKEFVDNKAALGRALHSRINAYVTGTKWDPPLDYEMEQWCDKYWDWFLSWYKEASPKILYSEMELIGAEYGGTLDCICEMFGKTILLDFKTSSKPSSSQFIQLGGYLNLLEEMRPEIYETIEHCQIVTFEPKHGCTIATKTIDEMQKYRSIFNHAFHLFIEYDEVLRRDWNDTLADLNVY